MKTTAQAFAVMALLVLSLPVLHAASQERPGIQIVLPLYSGSSTEWSTAVNLSPPAAMIILNPANGPGKSQNSSVRSAVGEAQARGIGVVGYVPTDWANGGVPISTAEENIKEYYSWYGVNGILLDEVNDTCNPLPIAYYSALYAFVKSLPGDDNVVLNPGTAVGECYAGISDELVTFEGNYSSYLAYHTPSWAASYPRAHFLNIILEANNTAEMEKAIMLAASRNVGAVYVTDLGGGGADPYLELPSSQYLDLEVAYASSPSSLGSRSLTIAGTPLEDGVSGLVTVDYRSNLPFATSDRVYLNLRNQAGQVVVVSSTEIEPAGGGIAVATLSVESLPRGAYSATVFAVSASGVGVSLSVSFTYTA